ncbi:MAG: S-layer homology domain-containing protein [Oscillospiraceae bacterium]|nr:S-layer homology domain-containing protein [Oscillospiraceae bacterium]
MKKSIRKLAAILLAAVFTVYQLPAAVSADATAFHDVAGHWGEAHLVKLIEAGVMIGDGNGKAMPDRELQGSEAAVMLAKIFGIDVLSLDEALTGYFRTGSVVSREEAFVTIRKVFQIPDAPVSFTSAFPDYNNVSWGAEDHLLAMEYAGMISGKNGKIAPKDAVTRAEFAALLSKGIGDFIDKNADFANAEMRNTLIRKPGVTVENLTVEQLTVARGAGSGSILLQNCDIGTLHIGGGGEIHLINTNVTELIVNAPQTGHVRIVIDADSLVERLIQISETTVDGEVFELEDKTGNL